MFYRFTISFLRNINRFAVRQASRRFPGFGKVKKAGDIKSDLVKRFAPENTFVDIGCMWRVDGYFSFLAEECGAKKVLAVDIYPESKKFEAEKDKRNSKVEFIQGDINNKEVLDKVGLCEAVFCSGVLYHMPNPLHFLSCLRKICTKTLILATVTVPEIKGLKNTSVFYPFLSEGQRKFWNLGPYNKTADKPYEPGNEYSTWFWGFSPSCVESMLKAAGFEIKERFLRPFQAFYVCAASVPKIPLRH
ncbi:MAG: methyltransferase domain-containing protein [Candidatus Omnitrophica bacterium]|nr:methyltransferase domain-containing protein [Candidatus Omnitrophota bacterium]